MSEGTERDGLVFKAQTSSQLDHRLLEAMQTTLEDLNKTINTFNEHSSNFPVYVSVNHATHWSEIQALNQRLHLHAQVEDEKILEAKRIVDSALKSRLLDHLRGDIDQHIKTAISAQVKEEVDLQISNHLPVSLAQQASDGKRQVRESSISLQVSQARIRNSCVHIGNQDEPLAQVLKVDGSVSSVYPADLRSLFSYDLETVGMLMKDYDLLEGGTLEEMLGRFMRYIGICEFDLAMTRQE